MSTGAHHLRRARRRFVVGLFRFGRHDQTRLLLAAVAIGAVAAAAALGFLWAFGFVRDWTLGLPEDAAFDAFVTVPWWLILSVPTLGGLAIGLFVQYVMPGGRPQAVADVIESVALRDGRMPLTAGLGAAAVSAASIGVGASVGREGPMVHLGATLGSWIAVRLKLHRQLVQTLLGCGVAAGVAASFNAPIAGAFFALEVVIGQYAIRSFAPVVIASVTGTLIYRSVFGNVPAFSTPDYAITSFWEFPAFALLGIVSAVAALIFMWSVIFAQDKSAKIPVPPWVRTGIAGLLVGIIALAFPQVLGVGYATTDAVLNNALTLWLLLALIPMKIAATAISLGGGFGGGVFSPSLFIGATVGGAFGLMAAAVFPDLATAHGAYAMVGMGAVAAAVLAAPMSTILIVFELTGDYALTIAVMVAVVIASVIAQQVAGGSFFHWQLRKRGVDLSGGGQNRVLRTMKVRTVMDRVFETVAPDAPLPEIRRLLQTAPHGELFVIDSAGTLAGTITFADLREAAFDATGDADRRAGDVMRRDPPVLEIEESLDRALRILEAQDEPHIPVVETRGNMKLMALVHERDVVLTLNRALAETSRRG